MVVEAVTVKTIVTSHSSLMLYRKELRVFIFETGKWVRKEEKTAENYSIRRLKIADSYSFFYLSRKRRKISMTFQKNHLEEN